MRVERRIRNCRGNGGARSEIKGKRFEQQVKRVLRLAQEESGGKITFEPQAEIQIREGDKRKVDFLLNIHQPHQVRRIWIECQNRKRSRKDILDKIRAIRSGHYSHTYFFVYADSIGETLAKALNDAGIENRNLTDFRAWLLAEARVTLLAWHEHANCSILPGSLISSQPTCANATAVTFNGETLSNSKVADLVIARTPPPSDLNGDDSARTFG